MSLWLCRHPEFYVYNIIVPLCVIMIADWLTVLVPFDTEGKIELAVTVLLAFIFLLGLVSDVSPRTPDMPLLSNYIVLSLALSALNLACCVISMAVYKRASSNTPPLCLRVVAIRIWNSVCRGLFFPCTALARCCTSKARVSCSSLFSSFSFLPFFFSFLSDLLFFI